MAKKKRKKKTTAKKKSRRTSVARKKKTRRKSKKKTQRKSARRDRRNPLARASSKDLQAELERRQQEADDLQRRREALLAELSDIEATLSDYGEIDARSRIGRRRGPGRPPGSGRKKTRRAGSRGRGRGRNKMSLVDALSRTLNGKTLSVTDAADAVRKNGYHTKSDNFRTIVNQALLGNPGVFKRVSRGQYTAK